MAKAILGGRSATRKPNRVPFNSMSVNGPPELTGLVTHHLLSPDVQVRILDLVKHEARVSLAEVIAALPDHPAPVAAALALVEAGILQIGEGLIDGDIELTRSTSQYRDGKADAKLPHAPGRSEITLEMTRVEVDELEPAIFTVGGDRRRSLRDQPLLRQVGVYFGIRGKRGYVGMGDPVAARIAKNAELTRPQLVDRVICIVEKNDRLSPGHARVAERILAQMVQRGGEIELTHGLPHGAPIDASGYDCVRLFIARACMALRHAGLLFNRLPSASLLLSPAERPPFSPVGDHAKVYSLAACGLRSHVAEENGKWRLMRGSEIRGGVVPSAHGSAIMGRAELFHSGGLVQDGQSLILTQDLVFDSASSASHFTVGGKTRADVWKPLRREAASGAPRP